MLLLSALACTGSPDHHGPHGGKTPTVPGCATIGAVTVSESPNNALERGFAVDLSGEARVWVLCAAADGDQLLGESAAPSLHQDVVVRGLRANTAYGCDVHVACGGPVEHRDLTTGGPPVPPFEVTSPEGASQAYTLFNTQRGSPSDEVGSWLLIVDPEGAVRWAYRVGSDLITDLDAQVIDEGAAVHVGGGWAWFRESQSNRGVFRDVDLSGNTLLDRAVPDFGLGFNHHSEKLDDRTYLSLTGSNNADADDAWYGVGVEQWDPAAGLVWSWSSQGLVDEGVLAPPPYGIETPYHANSVSFVDDAWGSAVWVSLYGAREIWRLDRATGERTHVFGPNGDFTLRDATGAPLGLADWTYVQHDPDYGPDGRVLMYDNGQGRPVDPSYSRVVEFQLDLDARTATELWEHREDNWYDPVLGDADYLPNGDVLVARGFNVAWTPESSDVSQIEELRPPDDVVWRLKFTDRSWEMFRAQRYDGCLLFSNPAYCDDVADRIAALRAGSG